jgi:hypothetical protein
MATVNEVYQKIKEISKRTANPRPEIVIQRLAEEMQQVREQILPILVELKDLRLIKFNQPAAVVSIRLTLLGHTVNR